MRTVRRQFMLAIVLVIRAGHAWQDRRRSRRRLWWVRIRTRIAAPNGISFIFVTGCAIRTVSVQGTLLFLRRKGAGFGVEIR